LSCAGAGEIIAQSYQWRALRDEVERKHPELAKIRSEYTGWLVGFLNVDPATGVAEGIGTEDPAGSTWIRWEPGRRYIVRQVPEAGGAWCLCREPALWWRDAPEPEALLITSSARFADTDPEPAVPAWAPGSDGVGPSLQAPDCAPVRWLLMDGYVYDIRADQTLPPWQEGRWAVNEWRPQPWREILADPLEEM
jgi:hypothetical protein